MLENIGVFKGITGKMGWLNYRQILISQNVSNADTPNYVPQDAKQIDFSEIMRSRRSSSFIRQEKTDMAHLSGTKNGDGNEGKEQKIVYEPAADGGNKVVLEEQLFKAQKTNSDYQLMAGLYRKNANMLRIAIGKA